MAEKVIDRFFRYVQIDTQSKEDAESFPSTEKQKNLAMLLAKELQEMGASDVIYDEERCYVYAKLPGNDLRLCLCEDSGKSRREDTGLYCTYGYVTGLSRKECEAEAY